MTEQQKEIDRCFAIENNKKALACMKELVGKAEGDCCPKLVLLTQESCTPCEEERELHKEDIKKGIVQEVSVDTQEGFDIAALNEIEYFPTLVLLDCNNRLIYPSD